MMRPPFFHPPTPLARIIHVPPKSGTLCVAEFVRILTAIRRHALTSHQVSYGALNNPN